jgi:hypothetical protein
MHEERITESPSWSDPWGQVMKTPDDVAEMLRLRACGWGLKRIALPEIGTSGSMSGDGKRGVAEWPKLPRPSSTLPNAKCRHVCFRAAVGAIADLTQTSFEDCC